MGLKVGRTPYQPYRLEVILQIPLNGPSIRSIVNAKINKNSYSYYIIRAAVCL